MKKVYGRTTGSRLAKSVYSQVRDGTHATLADYVGMSGENVNGDSNE